MASEWTADEAHHWHDASCGREEHRADKATHDWNEGEIITAATETDDGETLFTCTTCGTTKTEAIPALGHEHIIASEWTADEQFHWHDASCGREEHRTGKTAHEWDNGTITKAATEQETGEKAFTCTVCDRIKTEVIPTLKHEHTMASEWTSDEAHHWHDASCGKEEHRTSKTAHTWDTGKTTKAATCTAEGERTYTCTVCSETKTEAIAANGHRYNTTWKSDASGHWNECDSCGKKENFAEHATMTMIVTLTSDGERKEICPTCGYGAAPSAWTKETLSELSEALKNYAAEDAKVKVVGELSDTNAISVALLEFSNGYKAPSKLVALDLSGTTGLTTVSFKDCTSLASIQLPDSVTEIGDEAFYYCRCLTNITIPKTVTRIGEKAFYYCQSLTSITIPNNVTEIGDEAFYYCRYLTNITIPNSVAQIGSCAFAECSNLASVTLPNGITEIVDKAFYNCKNLANITIPKTVTRIGNYAFYYCQSLTNITIPTGVTEIGMYAFADCFSFTSITIPNSVTQIGIFVFAECLNLASVTFPNGITEIVDGMLGGTALTNITIPKTVTRIGKQAFEGCDSLTSIMIPNSVTEIGRRAFSRATLKEITIPNSITTIEYEMFLECPNLTSITIPNSVTKIGERAFYACKSLKSVKLPSSITEIGEYAFAYSKIEDIELSTALTKIAAFTFYHCEFLNKTTIKIPASVTLIEYRAFEGCLCLSRVEFEAPSGWYVTYNDGYGDEEHEIYPADSPIDNATRLSYPGDWRMSGFYDRYGVKWINDIYKK
ncbi:MAG: leucine-rich repeat domain-containing protein [Treponema sp.]|nr:leucine-rich repeat domain-containing protein [Treponema sp.]